MAACRTIRPTATSTPIRQAPSNADFLHAGSGWAHGRLTFLAGVPRHHQRWTIHRAAACRKPGSPPFHRPGWPLALAGSGSMITRGAPSAKSSSTNWRRAAEPWPTPTSSAGPIDTVDAERAERLVLVGVVVLQMRVVTLQIADRPPVELDDQRLDRNAVDMSRICRRSRSPDRPTTRRYAARRASPRSSAGRSR